MIITYDVKRACNIIYMQYKSRSFDALFRDSEVVHDINLYNNQ